MVDSNLYVGKACTYAGFPTYPLGDFKITVLAHLVGSLLFLFALLENLDDELKILDTFSASMPPSMYRRRHTSHAILMLSGTLFVDKASCNFRNFCAGYFALWI